MLENNEATKLMQLVAEGDEKAFRRLAKEAGPCAFVLANRLLDGDLAEAEDVVQNVLVKLWQTAPRWKPIGSVMGYVHRLTYTTSMDVIRRRKLIVGEVEEQGANETVTSSIFDKQRKQHVYGILQGLPERQRVAVVMTYLQEMPQKEVAKTMNTSVKAVESLLTRAKRSLAGTAKEQFIREM